MDQQNVLLEPTESGQQITVPVAAAGAGAPAAVGICAAAPPAAH